MATDNFNRADESPLQFPWTQEAGSGGDIILVSNAIRAAGSSDKLYYYDGAVTVADQYSQANIVTKPTANDWGPACRIGTNGFSGYIAAQYDSGSNFRGITKFVSGSFTVIASGGATSAVGDTVGVEAEGTTIRTKKNGVTDLTTTDSSLTGTGNGVGVFIYEPGGAIDDWEGGDLPPDVQALRPDADLATANWVTTPLWSKIDEDTPDGIEITDTSASGAGTITRPGGVAGSGATTTSITFVVPASVQLGDLLDLVFVHRGTGDGTVSDNSGDGVAWTRKGECLFATSTFSIQHYYKRVTSQMVGGGDTITVSGLTNACAGALEVYRGAIASGDPYRAWTTEANASGNVSHAALTGLLDNDWVVCVIGNSPDLAVTPTSPLVERYEHLSTGGTDASLCYASFEMTANGSSGTLAWTQTAAASGSLAYAVKPAGTETLTSVARVSLTAGTDPGVNTGHNLKIRAKSSIFNEGRMRMALYEGANNRSGDLEISSNLGTTYSDFTIPVPEASVANITSYADLEIRFWGRDANGMGLTFAVDKAWFEIPAAAGTPVAGSDVGSASAESGAVIQRMVGSDVGAGGDAGTIRFFATGEDARAASEAAALLALAGGLDVGAASETAIVAQKYTGVDVGAGADTGALTARVDGADIRSAVDAGALLAAIFGSDLASAITESAATLVSLSGADVLAGAVDSGTVRVPKAGSDVGAAVELASQIAAVAAADVAGPGADNAQLVTFVFGVQTTAGTVEVAAFTVSVLAQDAGVVTEAALVAVAAIPASDAGLGTDVGAISGTLITVFGLDAATGADLATMVAPVSGLDARAATDIATVAVPKAGSDSGSMVEAAIMTATALLGIDARPVDDLGSMVARPAGSDVGTDVETIRLMLGGTDPVSAFDTGALRASYALVDNPTALDLASILYAVAVSDLGSASEDARAALKSLLAAIRTGRIARGSRQGRLDRGSSGRVRGR